MHQSDERALDLAAPYAPDTVARAREVLASPWRVAVVGRVGVGKTTWLNRLTGGSRATGLRGTTLAAEEVVHDGVVWVDTPGIDAEDHAIAALAGVVGDSDAVLWIVDGLQPATATERRVLETVTLAGQPRAALVARLDLVDKAERDAVLERVRSAWELPTAPWGGDLRRAKPRVPDAIAPAATSPRRQQALARGVLAAVDAVRAMPPAEDRTALTRRLADDLRARVRDAVARVNPTMRAAEALHHELDRLREDVLTAWGADPNLAPAVARGLPSLHAPEPKAPTPLGVVAAAMGGEARARAELKAQGARFLADAQVAVADWIAAVPDLDREVDRRAALLEAAARLTVG